jgi:hypothetical protein
LIEARSGLIFSELARLTWHRYATGVWPFHCHIAWHVSAGFFIQFMTNPDKLKEMRIPSVVAETCRQWGKWTETNIPDQIDSGL